MYICSAEDLSKNVFFIDCFYTAVNHPKHCQNNTLLLYIYSSQLRSSKGEGPELLQMFTGARSLDTFISLHLFRLSAKDLLLLSTQLQRLTNPKNLSVKLALHGLFFLFWTIGAGRITRGSI